jgi:hypothetical protein
MKAEKLETELLSQVLEKCPAFMVLSPQLLLFIISHRQQGCPYTSILQDEETVRTAQKCPYFESHKCPFSTLKIEDLQIALAKIPPRYATMDSLLLRDVSSFYILCNLFFLCLTM